MHTPAAHESATVHPFPSLHCVPDTAEHVPSTIAPAATLHAWHAPLHAVPPAHVVRAEPAGAPASRRTRLPSRQRHLGHRVQEHPLRLHRRALVDWMDLDTLVPRADGYVYGADEYYDIWSTTSHVPSSRLRGQREADE